MMLNRSTLFHQKSAPKFFCIILHLSIDKCDIQLYNDNQGYILHLCIGGKYYEAQR